MRPHRFLAGSLVLLLTGSLALAQTKTARPAAIKPPPAKAAAAREELTLEKIFPKKGLFGPSASGMAFSHDGKYAAYLYRPYEERRHASDLWVLDLGTGKVERVTSPEVMARFQASARKVKEDRAKKN